MKFQTHCQQVKNTSMLQQVCLFDKTPQKRYSVLIHCPYLSKIYVLEAEFLKLCMLKNHVVSL